MIHTVLSGLILVALGVAAKRDADSDTDILPGWQGSNFRPAELPSISAPGRGRGTPEPLDWESRIFLWRGFLSPEEADHIRELAAPSLTRSNVADNNDGHSELSEVRTSKGTFLRRRQDPIVEAIEERIAAWTLLPVENGEGLQVLRYQHKEKYEAHYDYFHDTENVKNGGNRAATVLMYLADTEEGGETAFPNVPAAKGANEGFSACAKPYLAAKPRKGDAILFHSMTPEGTLERGSLHVACPVIKGEKWSAAKWIHVRPFETPDNGQEAARKRARKLVSGCRDHHEQCNSWAQAGECTNNPLWMIGTQQNPGNCVRACNKCAALKL